MPKRGSTHDRYRGVGAGSRVNLQLRTVSALIGIAVLYYGVEQGEPALILLGAIILVRTVLVAYMAHQRSIRKLTEYRRRLLNARTQDYVAHPDGNLNAESEAADRDGNDDSDSGWR